MSQPHKFKFARVVPPSATDLERESIMPEEQRSKYVPKRNCYAMTMPSKEMPTAIKNFPLELECAVKATTQHSKVTYKAAKFEFYKTDGCGEAKDAPPSKEDGRKNKKKFIFTILLCLGDSITLDYDIKDNNIDYGFKEELASGDAFFVDQSASGFAYRVE